MARNLNVDAPAPVRSRARVPVKPAIPQEMIDLAVEYYVHNAAKNEANRKAEAAKKKLNVMMEAQGVRDFETVYNNKIVEAVIESGVANVVDNDKVIKTIGQQEFNRVASVTQTVIKAQFGDNMLMKVLVEVETDPALKIREKK